MSYEEIRPAKIVKGRKRYSCEWCGEAIAIGDKSVARVYKWEGELFSVHQHPECYAAMEKSYKNIRDGFEPYECERGVQIGHEI